VGEETVGEETVDTTLAAPPLGPDEVTGRNKGGQE
jgi:hypothetical protein